MTTRLKNLTVTTLLFALGIGSFQNCGGKTLFDASETTDSLTVAPKDLGESEPLAERPSWLELIQRFFDNQVRYLNALEDNNPINGDLSKLTLRDKCTAFSAFALASLYLNSQVARANSYISALVTDPNNNFGGSELPQNGGGSEQVVPCSGVMQYLARIALDEPMTSRLSAQTRVQLRNALWRYVYDRSRVSELTEQNIWSIRGTENHHSLNYGGYYLSLLELSKTRATDSLADGHTVSEHIHAWNRYWKWFLQGRALKGLHAEARSSTYAQYTLITYYNLRDLSPDRKVRRLADHFLTLNWADVAQEFLKETGTSGGATIRTYRDAALVYGRANQVYHLSYVYGWHNINSGQGVVATPPSLIPIISEYRPPEIVKKIATTVKPAFHYLSRRIGRTDGPASPGSDRTDFTFGPNGETSLLRYSYVTPDYVLGAMSFDPGESFSVLTDKERTAGVVDASHADARLVITGRTALRPRSQAPFPELLGEMGGRAELSSIGLENTLIAARDVKAILNGGIQVFISSAGGMADPTRLTASDTTAPNQWIFTRSERAYYAIRFPGTYTVRRNTVGVSIQPHDKWVPIVIQTGRIRDYQNEADFRQTIINHTTFVYNPQQKKLDFTDMRGRQFEYWCQSAVPPKINHRNIDFNPASTYSSPYISTHEAEHEVVLQIDGESLTLDFN